MTIIRRSAVTDIAGTVLIAVSMYWTFFLRQHPYSAIVLLIAGLSAFSLSRRKHPSPLIAAASRYVWSYAPTAIVLIFVGAFLQDFGRHFTRADFGMFYASGLQLRTDPAHLYDVETQHQILELVTGTLEYHYLTFPYPPFVAALFVPLSYMSLRSAYYVMAGCNLVLLATAIYLLSKTLCRTRNHVLTLVLGASALLPIYINIVLGQMAFVGLLLYSLFAIDLLRGRDARAGLWVALLSYKMMLVPIPLFILFTKHAWRGILVAFSGFAALLALSLALVGTSGITANYRVLTMMTNESLVPRMQSLRALTHYLGLPSAAYWLLTALILVSLWFIERRSGESKWALAGAVLASLLVSPYVQSYDLSLGLLVIALVVASFTEISDWRRAVIILAAFLPAFAGVAGLVGGLNWPAVPAATLMLFCYCVFKSARWGRRAVWPKSSLV